MRKWPTTKRRASNPNAMSTIPVISPMTVSCCVVRDANGGVAKKAGTAHARSARSPAFGVVVEATRRESRFKLSFTAGLCLPHEVCQKHLTDGWALFGEEIHLPLCAGAARTDGLRVRNAELESFIKGVADRLDRRALAPAPGSKVNHRALTAAVIDGRDFVAAKRRADTEVLVPPGLRSSSPAVLDFNDHRTIWDRLDQVHTKHLRIAILPAGMGLLFERIEPFANEPAEASGPPSRIRLSRLN
jgi:hypothetical protein